MFISFQRAISSIMLIGVMVLMLGCSGGSNPIVPASGDTGNDDSFKNYQETAYEGENILGAFSLTLDATNISASVQPILRQNAMNVSRYVNVEILGLNWDDSTRIWDIDVSIENTTQYSGFGPWIVFNVLGEQRILDQDGLVWWVNNPGDPPERIPVVAFAKDNPQRIFQSHSAENVHIKIHWPPGCDSFYPINFFIDASYPNPRQHPIVENLHIEPLAAPESFNLTAHIWDWQAPPSGGPGIEAWVDLTPVGGPGFEPLFDDGQHGDGAPHDGIWGCFFNAIPDPSHPNCLTVHAVDWQGYRLQNDVCFGFGPPPECLPMELIDEGPMGFRHPFEMIVRDPVTWEDIWFELHPDPGTPPPPIDFQREQAVVVMLGERPSTGFFVHIDCVKEIGGPDGGPYTIVDYMEEIPGPDCDVEWVPTFPYQIMRTQLTTSYMGQDQFFHHEHVYECGPPPDCVDQRDLAKGQHSLIHEPRWQVIYTHNAWWNFWIEHGADIPEPPPVEFPYEMVVVGMIGDRPTTGWSVNIECIKFLNEDTSDPVILIEAVEIEPGPNCDTEPIITQPFHFVAVPHFEGRVDLILRHEIDPCEPPPDCVDFRVLDDGPHSLITEPVEAMFTEPHQWFNFWEMHGANTPAPEVDWTRENVVVLMTGERPTGGFWVRVDCVSLIEDPAIGRVTLVEYTEMIPGPGCPTPDVLTQPHIFIAIPKLLDSRDDYIRHEEIYECPPPDCHPFIPLADGNFSQIHHPVESVFDNIQDWHQFWFTHDPNQMPPEVDFDIEVPVALMLGDRNTGGFWIRVDCVRFIEEPGIPPIVTIEYTEMIPGPDCIVPQVITQPFFFMAIPRFGDSNLQYEFMHSEEIYNCGDPDCLPQETLDQGHMSQMRDSFFHIFRNMDSWNEFWLMHNPHEPPPPVNFDLHMVVVAFLGERPTSGYFASIECIWLSDPDPGSPPVIMVDVREHIPGDSCEVYQVLTYPFHIVVTPRHDGEDEFTVEEMVYECP